MEVDERARHELHGRLGEVLGRREAATLMSMLPPVGWADVATKRDLDMLAADIRAELRSEIGALRGEFGELRGQFGELRGDMRGEIGQLRAEFHRDLAALTRTMMISMLTTVIAVAGLAFGAARLG